MLNFLLDQTSYYIGIAAGFFAWWLFQQARPILKTLRQIIDEQIQSFKEGMSTTIEQRYRQDIVRLMQGNHIVYRLFSLKEIAIPPRLMAPPTPVIPEGNIPPDDITQIAVPFIPDWADVAAAFGAKTFSIAEAMARGANLLIYGKPGSGKTFALSHFTSQIAQRYPDVGELGNLLPVMVHAGNLDLPGKKGKPLDVFFTALKDSVSSNVEAQLASLLKTVFISKFALVIIDGYDEIPPDDQSVLVKFIKNIQTKYPGNRYIISTAAENISCHETLGLHPIPIAAWSKAQKQDFVDRWGKLWQKYIPKQSWAKKIPQSINPIFYSGWLNDGANADSPLHLTLRTWALYTGDVIGPTEVNALESYIRRMTNSVVNAQPALEQLAVQITHTIQPIIALKSAGSFVSDFETDSPVSPDPEPEPSPVDALQEIELDNPSAESSENPEEFSSLLNDDDFEGLLDELDDLEIPEEIAPEEIEKPKKSSKKKDKPIKKRQVYRLLPELVKTDLLIYRPNSKIGFANPVVNGYLTAKGLANQGGAQQLSSQPNWSGKTLATDYLAAKSDIEPLIGNLLEKDKNDPMKRGLLSMANWPRYAPKGANWLSPILRVMADTLQQDSLPLSLRSKILAAMAFSGETQIGTLFRQMLKSEKHSVRWLGALGCGLIRDKKSVDQLGLLLIYDNSVFINRAASLALVVINTNKSLELLTRALLEGNEEVRRAAAEGLARHPTEGFPVLRDGATVEDILVRRAVVYGLVIVNEPWAIELLEKMQLEDDQWVIRNAATQGLEDIKSISVSVPTPQTEIHETPWLLKFASEKGMGVSPGQAGWDMLKASLTGGNEDQKLAAMDVYRLKPSEARNVIKELYQLMKGPEGDVREAAYVTLWYMAAAGINLPTISE